MATPAAFTPRLLALGDSAWTLVLGRDIEAGTLARVAGLAQQLAAQQTGTTALAGITDVVPAFASLTVHFDPWIADADALGRHLLALARQHHLQSGPGRQWTLPLCCADDFAPDLPHLCEVSGLSRTRAIGQLLSTRLRVCMIGFQPGFPYMAGLPPALSLPRRASPRQKVPAQSVAIAGGMCGIYPWDSPGGWNLLGRTPVRLFDPTQTRQPALLAAGDEVCWTEVDRPTHDRLLNDIARGMPRETFLTKTNA